MSRAVECNACGRLTLGFDAAGAAHCPPGRGCWVPRVTPPAVYVPHPYGVRATAAGESRYPLVEGADAAVTWAGR